MPIIIAVAVLIYRVYTNFQKEQEKARKRNPAERSAETYPSDVPQPGTTPPHYEYEREQELVEETYSPERPYEPVYKRVRPEIPVREVYKETKYEPMVAEKVVVNKYKEESAREIKLGKAIHAPHKHGITMDEEKEGVQERSAYADFDIHDAVIKSAILNRPEY